MGRERTEMTLQPRSKCQGTRYWMALTAVFAVIGFPASGQTPNQNAGSPSLASGGSLIGPGDLPPILAASLRAIGGRMTSPSQAQVTLTGTTTDANGSRAGQIIIQAPLQLSYREGNSLGITFDGTQFQTKTGPPGSQDEAILESFLADFPDTVLLQAGGGGTLRRIGGHFRSDNGKTANYSGPWWTVFAFSPPKRAGLTRGQALQQQSFIEINEQTGFVDEVRLVLQTSPGHYRVTQTQFQNWTQYGGQWFPSQIVRLENGSQTLSFQVQQASAGPALNVSAFQP